MTDNVVPEAFVDSLAVVGLLSGESVAVAPVAHRRAVGFSEVHLFAYLGCLLNLYQRKPTAGWGYSFIRLESGLPFSESISAALSALGAAGLVERSDDDGFLLSARGRDALRQFASFGLMRDRVELMRAGCDAAITIPPAIIRNALNLEPGLSVAMNRALHTTLGSEGAREALYEHFGILHRALGANVGGLLIPALAWLTYLSENIETVMQQKTGVRQDLMNAN